MGRRRPPTWTDSALYALWCAVVTLVVATLFYAVLRQQIFYSSVRGVPELRPDDWSAPLDDVFIHFDFARAIARGHPFEWSEGNGYSSGGTSLLYPFALAVGYALGFQEGRLMEFAAILACTCVFASLWLSQRLFRDLPWWTKYGVPPMCLGVGAVDWSLFSGMEVAFFMLLSTVALVAWDDLCRGPVGTIDHRPSLAQALVLGLCGGLVVATRPEAAVLVAILAVSGAVAARARIGALRGGAVLLLAALPGAIVIVGHAVANKLITGDSSAAGALVKLELHHPLLSAEAVWDAWLFHVRYQVGRVTGHHVGGDLWSGSLLWVLAAAPLLSARTRRYAAVLWGAAVLWVLVVALNGQVRWQNERYTMPAVAWLLTAAALGVGMLLSLPRPAVGRRRAVVAAVGTVMTVGFLAYRQLPRFGDQVWFFARASRNIRDQHIRVGRQLARRHPTPRRVLVGDAGAIPYVSDLPALDIIGLGGYQDLPFARASRWGVAAAVELIERIPVWQRPDVMAIYPTWWGDFPLWFGRPIDGVSVRGNVICGGLTKMIYRADWSSLDTGERPLLERAAQVADRLDVADVVSEKEHGYRTKGALGYVTMKLLRDPRRERRTLWDAGRILPSSARATFHMRALRPGHAAEFIVRLAPSQAGALAMVVAGEAIAPVPYPSADGWHEVAVAVPAAAMVESIAVELGPTDGELAVYHVWLLQEP